LSDDRAEEQVSRFGFVSFASMAESVRRNAIREHS